MESQAFFAVWSFLRGFKHVLVCAGSALEAAA